MNKYNHGTTIIEVLISIIIISIMIALLMGLLVQVEKDDEQNNINSSFLLAQASLIKEIEEDSINYEVKRLSSCSLRDANIKDETVASDDYLCLRIEYNKNKTIDYVGYLAIYKYYKNYGNVCPDGELACNDTWVIRYSRGHYLDCVGGDIATNYIFKESKTVMKEYLDNVNIGDIRVSYNTDYDELSNINNAGSASIPVWTNNGRHYDINLSFMHKIYNTVDISHNFICDRNSLKCTCYGSNCDSTYPNESMLDDNNKYKFTC